MRRRVAVAFLVLVLLHVTPDIATACPVCFDMKDRNRAAFLATTIFLSLLPLGMLAGLGVWLRRRARSLDAEAAPHPSTGVQLPAIPPAAPR